MAQQSSTMKARSLSKDEVMMLITFIGKKEIITTKATNATNNRLKEMAWKEIADEFSAHVGETRRPEQLRLKWENLKKAARKRSAAIRQNNLKTGGGKACILPDEVLDRVAGMLGATCSGFTVDFGGDGEGQIQVVDVLESSLPDLSPMPQQLENVTVLDVGDGEECGSDEQGQHCTGGGKKDTLITNYSAKKILFNTPKNSYNKRRKLADELQKAQKEKELALAAYFRAKTVKVELEIEKLKREIELLKQ